jgi:outer membrane protein assembly factor BamB
MRILLTGVLLASIEAACLFSTARAADWPQFRGPNAAGLAAEGDRLPVGIGPERHVVWKAPLPPGHSSPVVFGERIYLTAEQDEKLFTFALDRATGKTLWQAEAPYEKLEEVHRIGSHAQCTCATDGKHVVSFFGSSGLFCYDTEGNKLWHRPFGPFKNTFGAGSSPLLVDGRIILSQDHDTDSFLMALDVANGREIWKVERPDFLRNYGTPVIWNVDGRKQVVVAGTLRVVGYDFDTGKEVWIVHGIARFVSATPTVGPDNVLYASGLAAGNDVGADRFEITPFDVLLPDRDKNKNGTLEEDELPDGAIKERFPQTDRNKDQSLTRDEYETFRRLFAVGRNVVIAIKPGGSGDITNSHVLWTQTRHVPFCASPLLTHGRIFTVRDTGILTSLAADTGRKLKEGRLPANGSYYSSPVAGDGKVYLLDENGKLTIVTDDDQWEVIHTADFGENCYATPALIDGRIYLRTNGYLYCFGS